MAWTDVVDSVFSVGKPITSTSYGYLRDNSNYLKDLFDITTGHDHNGGGDDGAKIPQGGLKTATGSVDLNAVGPTVFTLPGGTSGFYPQLRCSHAIRPVTAHIGTTSSTSNITTIELTVPSGGGIYHGYAQQLYIQASPPYKIGGQKWNHFLYALVNSSGDIIAAYEAEDPPYAYNGPPQHGKDSIERIAAVPHPFADYWEKDPAADGLEIVLFDLREKDVKKWRGDMGKQGKGILEDLGGNVNPAGIILPQQSLGLPNIPGFTDKVKIRR